MFRAPILLLVLVSCGRGPNLALGEGETDDTMGGVARTALALFAAETGGDGEILGVEADVNGETGELLSPDAWTAALRSVDDPSAAWWCVGDDSGGYCQPNQSDLSDVQAILEWTVDSPRACRRLPNEEIGLAVTSVRCLRHPVECLNTGVESQRDVEIPERIPAERAAYYYHHAGELSMYTDTRVIDGVTGWVIYRD